MVMRRVGAAARVGSGRLVLALVTATVGGGSACTDAEGDGNGGAATGAFAGSAAGMPAGSSAPAGFTAAGSVASGTGGAPAPITGGVGGSGGTQPLAGSGGAAGVGAAGSGGSGGMGGSGGVPTIDAGVPMVDAGSPVVDAGGTTSATPTPSAGCSNGAGRPAGGLVSVAQSHYFAFPSRYDGTQPFPVLMGFHGCGGVNRGTSQGDTEWMRLTNGSAFEAEYVRVVPLSSDAGGCWSYGTDIGRVTQMYDDLLANYCVDTSRVFATGHSSGAQLVVQILTSNHVADAQHLSFAGVAPVAASDYGPMTGPIPAMYIQGMMDAERGNGDGHETVERFRAANGCGDTSMPYPQVSGCQSGATSVSPGCVSYDGCDAPTIWCSHNDPAYSGTMHGVPCFAITAMHDFFESL